MKKFIILTVALVFMSTSAFALIGSSAHDFSGAAWAVNSEICNVCHTPHNADVTVTDAPLWDHEVSVGAPGWIAYDNTTNTQDSAVGNFTGISLLCLSCHDGTVELDSFGGVSGGTFIGAVPGNFGTDLSNDHPIGITYDAGLQGTDGELNDPTIAPISDWLFSGQLECASCHDVHNQDNNTYMLRIPNSNSDLCLTCHAK